MNCDTVRSRLLGQSNLARVPSALDAHLDACPACRTWHQLAVRIEGGIAATAPAPSPGLAKRRLIAQFAEVRPAPSPVPVLAKPAAAAPVVASPSKSRVVKAQPVVNPVRPAAGSRSVGERLARMWPAGLVAAALLVGVLVWSSIRSKPDNMPVAALPPDPLLEKVVAAKVKLDAAPNPTARLAVLDTLERDLHEEATTLSKITPGPEMESLARMYEKVVTEGMVEQAWLLDPAERRARLPAYKERLVNAEQEANRKAAEAPAGSDGPLKDIARAAQRGRIVLARMIQG